MLTKKRSFVAVLTLTCVLGFSLTATAASNFLSIATGGSSGTYFPIGGAIATAVTKGSSLKATAETGNASAANINLVARGEIEVAFAQNDISFWAYNGQLMFSKPLKNLRAVAALYPEHVQLIIGEGVKINDISELKGKRVGVGAAGSGVSGDVDAIFQVAGFGPLAKVSKAKGKDRIETNFLDFGATTNRFKDNQIDAGFVVAGFPTSSVMELATTKKISLLSFSDSFMKKLSAKHPYFVPSIIPAGTYSGIDKDVKTPAVMAILVTHDKISEDTIYAFTKAMFTNIKDIHASHAKGKEINLETALDGLTVPLHPGAAKFYKEKGLLK